MQEWTEVGVEMRLPVPGGCVAINGSTSAVAAWSCSAPSANRAEGFKVVLLFLSTCPSARKPNSPSPPPSLLRSSISISR